MLRSNADRGCIYAFYVSLLFGVQRPNEGAHYLTKHTQTSFRKPGNKRPLTSLFCKRHRDRYRDRYRDRRTYFIWITQCYLESSPN